MHLGAKHRTISKSFLQDGWLCLVHERVDCRIRKLYRMGYIHPSLLLRLREPTAWKERCNEALDKVHFRLEAWVWNHKRFKTRCLWAILQRSLWLGEHNSEQVLPSYWRIHDIFLSDLTFGFGFLWNNEHNCANRNNWSSKSDRLHNVHYPFGKDLQIERIIRSVGIKSSKSAQIWNSNMRRSVCKAQQGLLVSFALW